MDDLIDRVVASMVATKEARSLDLFQCRQLARSVLEAIREPTEAMQVAGHNVRIDPTTGIPTGCGTDEIWSAMIDVALQEMLR